MCADDLVLLAQTVKRIQKLVNECTKYGDKFDITSNRLKSNSMIISDRKLKPANFPCIYMNEELLEYVNKAKYLGHVIHCTLSDDDDIERQTNKARSHIHRHRYRHRRPISFKISVNIYINNAGHTWLTPAPICCPISAEIDPRSIILPAKSIGGLVGQSDCAILQYSWNHTGLLIFMLVAGVGLEILCLLLLLFNSGPLVWD